MTTRVLVVDDHALFRDGMASLLTAWGMEVVGQACDGLDAIEQARQLKPDLVLMDINMPRLDGVEATRVLRAEQPDVKVVIVTVVDDDESLFEAIRSGANGYLLKDTPGDEVGPLLAGITEGKTPLSSGLAARILDESAGNRYGRRLHHGLSTGRDLNVCLGLESGHDTEKFGRYRSEGQENQERKAEIRQTVGAALVDPGWVRYAMLAQKKGIAQ
jgi:DNA-binding NarL/FixJ family response regulator